MDAFVVGSQIKVQAKVEAKQVPEHDDQETYQLQGPAPRTKYGFSTTPDFPQTPAEALTRPGTGTHSPVTPELLESNLPVQHHVSEIVPSFWYPRMNRWRVMAVCLTYYANGLQDSATGALIPYMEKDYGIGYAVVSMIFVTNAVGFIAIAFGTDAINKRLGRSRTLMIAELIMLAGYVIIVSTPPFAGIVAAYLLIGIGYALNLSMNNVFVANLANSTVMLGLGHGSYGLGGVTGPLIATAMSSRGILWSRYYIITLGFRVFLFFVVGWAWRGYESEASSKFTASLERVATDQREQETSKSQLLKQTLSNRITLLGALFIFAYQGAEVSISGWVISFLIAARGGDASKVGYTTSGFWGGITLGRFVLVHAAPRVGEKRFVYLLTAGSAALQLLVWLVPNIIGEAVAVAVLGFLLGPVYPSTQTIFARLLPARLQMSSIGFIASAGSSGGAVAPLMTGLLAEAVGTFVLNPVCIALFGVMSVCWYMLPRVHKRAE